MPATVISTIDSDSWVKRILRLFPRKWSSDAARLEGGVLWALFKSLGLELEITNDNLIFVWQACRISMARGEALDLIAEDYFGQAYGFPQFVIRSEGESDADFRQRILDNMFLPAATRRAIHDVIVRFTGLEPRIVEPWRLQDTGAYDATSFFDVDTQANPSRYATPDLKYQAAIIATIPTIPGAKKFPFYTFDAGSGWDKSYFIQTRAQWLLTVQRMNDILERTKVYGTRIWLHSSSRVKTNKPLAGSYSVPRHAIHREVTLYPPFEGPYAVIATCNWNSKVSYERIHAGKFQLDFGTGAPVAASTDWMAAPLASVPGWGKVPVEHGKNTFRVGQPAALKGYYLVATPSWNTKAWVTSVNSDSWDLQFSAPAPLNSYLSFAWMSPLKSNYEIIQPDSIESVISVQATPPYVAFVLPSWNTSYKITKHPDHLDVSFAQSPDDAQNLYWAIYEY